MESGGVVGGDSLTLSLREYPIRGLMSCDFEKKIKKKRNEEVSVSKNRNKVPIAARF